MKARILTALLALSLSGCFFLAEKEKQQAELKAEVADMKLEEAMMEHAAMQRQVDSLQQLVSEKPKLVHLVFLTIKPSADKAVVKNALRTLKDIKEVAYLEVGEFEDLKDKRALSGYQVVMRTDFRSEEDYRVYAEHPWHLEVKKQLKPLLAAPPAVYDYQREK